MSINAILWEQPISPYVEQNTHFSFKLIKGFSVAPIFVMVASRLTRFTPTYFDDVINLYCDKDGHHEDPLTTLNDSRQLGGSLGWKFDVPQYTGTGISKEISTENDH